MDQQKKEEEALEKVIFHVAVDCRSLFLLRDNCFAFLGK